MRSSRVLVAGVAALGLFVATPAIASAAPPTKTVTPVEVTANLAAPFNFDVSTSSVLIADGGTENLSKIAPSGKDSIIAAEQPGVSGVAVTRNGRTTAFTTTVTDMGTFTNIESGLNIWGPKGEQVYADTAAYEATNNPDKDLQYGLVTEAPKCVVEALEEFAGGPATYTGIIDSHAYSVAEWNGQWVVADAGANALFLIDSAGNISTLAVLPVQPVTIPAEGVAEMLELDAKCEPVGITYNFESVPTDVEVGTDGSLYVTTLPGGPEDGSFGARGSVYKVDPNTGDFELVASGFAGATNLAIGKKGEIYVAELFGGQISKIENGETTVFASLPGVVSVEVTFKGEVWAGTMGSEGDEETGEPPMPGTLVKFQGSK